MEKSCVVCNGQITKKKGETNAIFEKKKYCSVACSVTKTSIELSGNRFSVEKGSVPWNKGVKYDDALKSRLDMSGLDKGRGLNLGKSIPKLQGENNPRWAERVTKSCKRCGVAMTLAPWQMKRVYCSHLCDKQGRAEERKLRDTKSCEICGASFVGLDKRSRFCSRTCASAHLAIKFKGRQGYRPKDSYVSGEAHPLYKPRIERTCKTCAKQFFVRQSDLIAGEKELNPAAFCSRKCKGLATRGAKSPVWKGGKLSDSQYMREKLHKMPEHKEWHAAILRRDGYQCVQCGVKSNGKNLQVDHIKTVASLIKKYRLRTTEQARECAELWDLSNGQTLCTDCHKKTPTFGRKKTGTG